MTSSGSFCCRYCSAGAAKHTEMETRSMAARQPPPTPTSGSYSPGRSWVFPDSRARLARWPKASVDEVEAPCSRNREKSPGGFSATHESHPSLTHSLPRWGKDPQTEARLTSIGPLLGQAVAVAAAVLLGCKVLRRSW